MHVHFGTWWTGGGGRKRNKYWRKMLFENSDIIHETKCCARFSIIESIPSCITFGHTNFKLEKLHLNFYTTTDKTLEIGHDMLVCSK